MAPSKKPSAFTVWITSASIHALLLIAAMEWMIGRPEWNELTASFLATPLGGMIASWYDACVIVAWTMAVPALIAAAATSPLRALSGPVARKLWRWAQWTAVNTSLLLSSACLFLIGLMDLHEQPDGTWAFALWFVVSMALFMLSMWRRAAENDRRYARDATTA